jgi:hypothetical protein
MRRKHGKKKERTQNEKVFVFDVGYPHGSDSSVYDGRLPGC